MVSGNPLLEGRAQAAHVRSITIKTNELILIEHRNAFSGFQFNGQNLSLASIFFYRSLGTPVTLSCLIYLTDTPTHQEVVLFKKERASSSIAVTPWVDPPHGFLGTIARDVYDGNIHK